MPTPVRWILYFLIGMAVSVALVADGLACFVAMGTGLALACFVATEPR